jgi:4-amino-4-deoxy-L-arabinose transferase-like glycosyltransferase
MVAIICRLLILLRPGYAWAIAPDSDLYIGLARGLRAGCGFAYRSQGRCAPPDFFRTPGYPLFLAMMPGLRAVVAAQSIMWGAICFLLGWFMWSRWGMKAALAAAGFVAVDIVSIINSSFITTDNLFALFVAFVVICQLWVISRGLLDRKAICVTLLAALAIGAATLIRPIGQLLVPISLVPALLTPSQTLGRRATLSIAAFLLSATIVGAWMERNNIRAGMFTVSAEGDFQLYYHRAAEVIWYRKGTSFGAKDYQAIQDSLYRQLCSRSPNYCSTSEGFREMRARGMRICMRDPAALAAVTLGSFALLALNPYDSNVYKLTGAQRVKTSSMTGRYREMFNGGAEIAALMLVETILLLLMWVGILLALVRLDWKSRMHLVMVLYPFAVALLLMAPSSGILEAIQPRFRVVCISLLAMPAAVGWFGTTGPKTREIVER